MTVCLWLVRHGSTDSTDARRFLGWKDEPLNVNGVRQAEELRKSLRDQSFQSVWSSDLERAVRTAESITQEVHIDPRLREVDVGLLEGKTWEECDPFTQEGLLRFEGFRFPGGESVDELRARVEDVLGEIDEPGDHLVVTHGGVIRLLLRRIGDDRSIPPGELVAVDWPQSASFFYSK